MKLLSYSSDKKTFETSWIYGGRITREVVNMFNNSPINYEISIIDMIREMANYLFFDGNTGHTDAQ